MNNVFQVFGPPGTGKTTQLTGWIRQQAALYGRRRVMACSFTRAAAAEIAGRGLGIPDGNVGTLHAHCYRAQGCPELTADKEADFGREFPRFRLSPPEGRGGLDEPREQPRADRPGDQLLTRMEWLRARMEPRAAWPEPVRRFAAAWDGWKASNGLTDFTDLLEIALRDVESAPGDPAVAVVDEIQDSPLLQLALFRKWARHAEKLLMAGDDDQAIYAWCGATPEAFLDLPVPEENRTVLWQSYRVPRAVHALTERWIARLGRRYRKEYLPRDCEGEVRRVGAQYKAPEGLLRHLERYLEAGKLVMVLGTCSYMLEPLLAVLRKRGIPFHNPYRRSRPDWNPLTPGTDKAPKAVDRALAFLRPAWDRPPEAGGGPCSWTSHDVYLWAGVLQEGVLRPGATEWLKALKGRQEPFDAGELLASLEPGFGAALERLTFHTPAGVRESLS